MSMGTDTKANTSRVAAHLRLVIFVSLRTAASAVAPLSPRRLFSRLRARGRMGTVSVGVSMGAEHKSKHSAAGSSAGGLLERLQQAALEALGESSSSFRTEVVASQTASTRDGGAGAEECQRALTERRTLGGSSVLERPDSAVLQQVKREQLRVCSIEAVIL